MPPIEMKAIITSLLEANSPRRTDNANTSLSGNTLRFGHTPLTSSLNFSAAQGTILLSSF
jgi:hypothetical protein